MANITRTALDANALINFPDNNTNYITPALLRDWLDDAVDSFVTQKDTSRLENAIYENEGSALTAAATVDLSSATGNFLHITGTGTISSFGTCPAGARFVLVFDGVCTLTYNATSLIIPGSANKTTAANDCCMIVSEGSGNWRIVGYFPIAGGTGGGTVTAVTATSPLASTGGTAPDISIQQASGSQNGYLSSTDWTTFNNKQNALGFTPVPDSRSISTSSPLTGGGDLSANRTIGIQDALADGSTKGAATFAASDFNAASGVISLDYANGQKASGSQPGFLSSTDWTTFNNKISTGGVTGSGLTMATSRLLGRTSAASPGAIEEISLTTTGTSGAATLSGGVLNIPQYSGGSGSGTVNSGTFNRLAYYATNPSGTAVSELPTAGSAGQILQSNGTGSAPSWVNAPAATLTIGTSIVSGATAGRLLLTTTSGANQVLNQDNNLNYDTTNDRLGIGVASPAARLDLAAPVAANPSLILAPSSGVTPTGTTNGSIWCDTTSSNTSLTMRKDSAYTKILTLDRNPDFAGGTAGIVQSDANGTLSKGADLTALGIYAQTDQKAATTNADVSLIGTVTGVTTLPANFFGVGKTITIFVSGLYSQANSSQTCTISLKIGATTLTNTLSFTHSALLTDVYWEAAFVLTCRTAGASGVIAYQGKGLVNHATNPLFSFMPAATVSSINTTGTLAIDVVARWSNTGVNSIRSDIHYANYIN